jgi:hypothetical protein
MWMCAINQALEQAAEAVLTRMHLLVLDARSRQPSNLELLTSGNLHSGVEWKKREGEDIENVISGALNGHERRQFIIPKLILIIEH